MGQQIIKQPNGKYAIFSSIVDLFIGANLTKEEVIDFFVEEEAKRITERINEILEQLERGEKPYLQFTQTLDEALKTMEEVHKTSPQEMAKFKKTFFT
jgi:hypothetical protein